MLKVFNIVTRGGYCNYMHLKPISQTFKKSLFKQMLEEHPDYKRRRRSRSKSKEKKSKYERDGRDERIGRDRLREK